MNPQETINKIVGDIKFQIMMMMNETADEFDERLTDPAARKIYNDFTAVFGQKILSIQIEVKN